ncbi:hypothetical protein LTR70_005529 [Exophiala xenobiotica]|uniref:Uncharacterized protein n=1 Tax=Lithohypha guttulata TaxID=1690604 RepID=A0ABR0K9K9_9EURO|nr:hypothetical protein LTR24_005253 [Lithohypha guttulata]KAK5318045.1 hypothetical protein LTR70_005529 [Exophiala xenobiotica]
MASRKDMRRTELVIPYVEPKEDKSTELGSTLTSSLPMAAMFTRNKAIGWVATVISLLNWISESPSQRNASATPGYLSFGMSILALGVTYMPLFMPPQANARMGATGTEAAPPMPPS